MRTVLLSSVAALLALGFTPAPLSRPDRWGEQRAADLQRLQGTWAGTHTSFDGREVIEDDDAALEIKGDQVTWYSYRSKGGSYVLTVRLRPANSPKQMLWYGERDRDSWTSCYSLEGDTLTLSSALDTRAPSPPDLQPGRGRRVMVFRRGEW